jgi:Domain of unknown function (DUF4390)
MHRAALSTWIGWLRAMQGARSVVAASLRTLFLASLFLAAPLVRPAQPELTAFEIEHDEEGVLLSYSLNFELSHSVEDALAKGVPLYFVAEAEVFRDRWYWRDRRVAQAVRNWRIAFQPLTFTYRATFGGLTQTYASRAEAFAAVRRAARWKIAEPGQIEEGSRHYVEFVFRLDTSLLPRPMQIGIGGQPDWTLSVERTQRFR